MKTIHKIAGKPSAYERAIENLCDEDLIGEMIDERARVLKHNIGEAGLRTVVIAVLCEDLRLVNLREKFEDVQVDIGD